MTAAARARSAETVEDALDKLLDLLNDLEDHEALTLTEVLDTLGEQSISEDVIRSAMIRAIYEARAELTTEWDIRPPAPQ